MFIRVDPRFQNGFTQEGVGGTIDITSENLATFTPTSGTVRKTRWLPIEPGETVVASVEMVGSSSSMSIYLSTKERVETKVAEVKSDSDSDLKKYEVRYSVPINETRRLIGVGFVASTTIGKFYKPSIRIENKVNVAPSLVACGLIDMVDVAVNPSFPNFGIKSVVLNNKQVIVTLNQDYNDNSNRPLPVASDGTITSNSARLICGGVTYANGEIKFYLYYVDTSGALIDPPPTSFAHLLVYY